MTFALFLTSLAFLGILGVITFFWRPSGDLGGWAHDKTLDHYHRSRDRSAEANASRPYLKE